MRTYAVTDRKSLAGDLLEALARTLATGVELLQIREKDLSGKALFELATAVRGLPNPHGTKILVNSRVDVALAAGLDGVHLPASAPPLEAVRRILPGRFLIGVSAHSLEQVLAADRAGADLIVFGPVFDTPSKRAFGPPLGLEPLGQVCRAAATPVFAIGGVTRENASECIAAGAAGVAGISLFREQALS